MFPFLIFWSLLVLVCGDNGRVDQVLIQKVYRQNDILLSEIGSLYTYNDVRLLLTRNYLKRNNIHVSMEKPIPIDQEEPSTQSQSPPK